MHWIFRFFTKKFCNRGVSPTPLLDAIKWYCTSCITFNLNSLKSVFKFTITKHINGVAESMGSVMDLICDKRRGLTIEENGKESMIHWNWIVVSLFDSLGKQSLNSLFRGRPWHFLTRPRAFWVYRFEKHLKKEIKNALLYIWFIIEYVCFKILTNLFKF